MTNTRHTSNKLQVNLPPASPIRAISKSALALADIEPALLSEALLTVVGRAERGSGLQDMRIIRFIGALGEVEGAWDVVPQTSVPRFAGLILETPLETLEPWAVLSASTPIPQLEEAIEKRLTRTSDPELVRIISVRAARKHVPHAMDRVAESNAWRRAEDRLENLLLPVATFLSADDIARLGQILTSNIQVREASSMPPLLEQLYGATPQTPDVQAAWEDVVSDLEALAPEADPNYYYAYPRLRELVRAASNE